MEHAHQLGVIHRDIKPANLLVDTAGQLWVTDFGLARLGNDAGLTMTGDLLGTLRYMSPEQALAQRGAVDARTDVYSLGVTLYELLTLHTAYDGRNREEVLRQITFEEPRPLRRWNSAVSVELETIVGKAIAKSPDERYTTAQELADDLRRYLEDKPIQARRPTLRQRAVKWTRRHRTVAWSAVVGLVLAAVGLASGTLLILQEKAKAATDLATAEAAARIQLETNLYFEHIALAEREWSANNLGRMKQLLDECPEDLRGWEWHYLRRLLSKTVLPLRHRGSVLCAVFSPDGRRIATADQEGWLKMWDAQTGQELFQFAAHKEHTRCVVFSPDGRRLVTGSWDGTVKTWDAETGQPLPVSKRHAGGVWSVVFSPDGRYLASAGVKAGEEEEVKVWDATTGADVLRLSGLGLPAYGLAFSPDGQRLAAVGSALPGSAGTITIWDLQTRQKQFAFGHAYPVWGVAFSPDGRLLASASGKISQRLDAGLKVWDMQTGQELRTLHGHTAVVYCVAFSPDGRRLASGSRDQTVKLWDVTTGREVLTLRGHVSDVRSVAFSPDGHRLVSASADQTVRVWDATPAAGHLDQGSLTLRGHGDEVNRVAFHPLDRRVLASAGADGTIRFWDLQSGHPVHTIHGHDGVVSGLAFTSDGRRLALAGNTKTIRIWDTIGWQEVPPSPLTEATTLSIQFSVDGRFLAAGGYSKEPVKIWNAMTGQVIHKLPNNWVTMSVAFSPDNKHLAVASNDGTVRVWDLATETEVVHPTLRHGGGATSVVFSPNGRRLASAGLDRTVKVWDTTTWKPCLLLRDETGSVLSVAFSPDGRRLAWGSTDGTIKVWDDVREEIHTLRGHMGWVNCVAFGPDGQQIASASADMTIKVWDVSAWGAGARRD
jgi:WD40 repeat protein